MTNIYIVILGNTNLPAFEEIIKAEVECSKFGYNLQVYILDPNIKNKNIENYSDCVRVFDDYYTRVFSSKNERSSSEHSSIFYPLRTTAEPVLYISSYHNNKYSLARSVHTKNYTYKYFECSTNVDIVQIVLNILILLGKLDKTYYINDTYPTSEIYNPLSGGLVTNIYDNDKTEFDDIMLMGVKYMVHFMRNDFLNKVSDPTISTPNWVYQTSSKWLQMLIDTYDISPGQLDMNVPSDIDIQMEYNTSSAFRKVIAEGTMSVLSNYLINNNKVTLEQVNSYGGWKKLAFWETLLPVFNTL